MRLGEGEEKGRSCQSNKTHLRAPGDADRHTAGLERGLRGGPAAGKATGDRSTGGKGSLHREFGDQQRVVG